MEQTVEQTSKFTLFWLKLFKPLFDLFRRVKIPGLQGLSLFDVLEMYSIGIINGAIASRASAISYSFFMSLFPFLLFVLNLMAVVSFIDYEHDVLPLLGSLFPTSTLDVIQDTIANIFEKKRVGLLSTSFVFSMFLMANGVNALFSGFEFSYHTKINTSFLKQYLNSLGVALLLALFLFLAVITIPVVEVYAHKLSLEGVLPNELIVIKIIKYIIITLMFYTVTAMFYYFGSPEKNSRKFFTPGATLSTILFLLATYLFGIYVNNFAQYNELYGSIGAILILMLYIWLNSNIILLGYELNASLLSLKKQASEKFKN
ncbi:YihY/virulence factor BrkB family protein [Flavobacteriaceae bacterium]|nr:YihY/virulence factor BrkB family protein [Flavobacteriaceae bacterium]